MNTTHAMAGLFPGDHFIHRLDFNGSPVIAYGLLNRIDSDGKYHADYQCRQSPTQPTEASKDSHAVVGRISKKAYELARIRNWPNTESEISFLIAYSAGKPIKITIAERLRLLFIH